SSERFQILVCSRSSAQTPKGKGGGVCGPLATTTNGDTVVGPKSVYKEKTEELWVPTMTLPLGGGGHPHPGSATRAARGARRCSPAAADHDALRPDWGGGDQPDGPDHPGAPDRTGGRGAVIQGAVSEEL